MRHVSKDLAASYHSLRRRWGIVRGRTPPQNDCSTAYRSLILKYFFLDSQALNSNHLKGKASSKENLKGSKYYKLPFFLVANLLLDIKWQPAESRMPCVDHVGLLKMEEAKDRLGFSKTEETNPECSSFMAPKKVWSSRKKSNSGSSSVTTPGWFLVRLYPIDMKRLGQRVAISSPSRLKLCSSIAMW